MNYLICIYILLIASLYFITGCELGSEKNTPTQKTPLENTENKKDKPDKPDKPEKNESKNKGSKPEKLKKEKEKQLVVNALRPLGYSAIETRQSDHEAFYATFPLGGAQAKNHVGLLSYNMWARGTRGGFDNIVPGFGSRKEPEVDKRVQKNLKDVVNFMNNHPNTLACLQEVGDRDLAKLAFLENQINYICTKTTGESFSTCVLYKTTEFSLINSNISAPSINQLISVAGDTQKNQEGRYTRIQLLNRASQQKIDLINVHLSWSISAEKIISALNSYLDSCSGTCVVAGDFNQDLSGAHNLNKASKIINKDGSQSSQNSKKKISTTDAIIYRLGR